MDNMNWGPPQSMPGNQNGMGNMPSNMMGQPPQDAFMPTVQGNMVYPPDQSMQWRSGAPGQAPIPSQIRPMFLPGRIVSSHDSIVPKEVNMDGSPSVFLKEDKSWIWVKAWNSNGIIETYNYQYVDPNEQRRQSQGPSELDQFKSEVLTMMNERLDKIESMISEVQAQPQRQTYNPNFKKNRQYQQRQSEEVKTDE